VRGGAVTLSAQAVKFVLQLGSTAVLARLLTPADFGLVAMVAAFTGFVSLFKDLGLSMATVQRAEITHEQVSTLFWINVAFSVILMAAAAALAPAVAWLYGEPRLTWIMLAVAGTFIFGGLSAQHTALLRRQMRFTCLAGIEVASIAAGVMVAMILAVYNAGYWALVAMSATVACSTMTLSWKVSGWRPGIPRRSAGAGAMLRFGGSLTGFSSLNYVVRNLDNILIGAALGAGPLGLYSKAYNLLMIPIRQCNGPLTAVALPALSRLQDRPHEYRRYYTKALGLASLVSMPAAAFCAAATPDIVQVFLGSQWSNAVPIFRALAPAAFVGALNLAPGWLCLSLGRPGRQLGWAVVSAPVSVVAFGLGLQWGAVGVAVAFSATWCAMLIAFIQYACKDSPVHMIDIWRSTFRPAAASITAAAVSLAAVSSGLTSLDAIVRLCIGLFVFGATYVLTLGAIPGGLGYFRDIALTLAHLRKARPSSLRVRAV
jgi:O-antigen/teichoic acid export membrane protein